jgi:hypothetical protein
MSEPTDDRLRFIASHATGNGYYSGGVKALRAVWNSATAAAAEERAAVVTMIREAADTMEQCANGQAESAGRAHRAGDAITEDALLRRGERIHTAVRSLRKTADAIEAGEHRKDKS